MAAGARDLRGNGWMRSRGLHKNRELEGQDSNITASSSPSVSLTLLGELYRARDSRLERIVAVKACPTRAASDPELLARFEREAKAIATLHNISSSSRRRDK